MRCTWMRTDAEGGSYFTDLQIPMQAAPTEVGGVSVPGARSEWLPATTFSFRDAGGGAVFDFHPAPRRQMVIVLTGVMEVESSRGERRQIRPGDALFADDCEGRGHIMRHLEAPLRYLMIQVPPGFDPSSWK